MRVVAAPGHTPGHTVVDIGAAEPVRYLADLVADREQLDDPMLASGFDGDDAQAQATRSELLAATSGRVAIASHVAISGPARQEWK